MDQQKRDFETIFKENERRIHYHVQKLGIRDPYNEFYTEGLYAMWRAYKKYEPDKGVLATYFNYQIRNHLIDILRKRTRQEDHEASVRQSEMIKQDSGNRNVRKRERIVEVDDITVKDDSFWLGVKGQLTGNQWKWVEGYIVNELSLKEIAEKEGVTVDAVKSWGREARKKLRKWKGIK